MRNFVTVCTALFMLTAAEAYAGPIIFYNYTPNMMSSFQLSNVNPGDHQALSKAPSTVAVSFTQPVAADKSDIKVYDPYNNVISTSKQLTNPTTLSTGLTGNLYAGSYRIQWSATCACASKAAISGSSYFKVQ